MSEFAVAAENVAVQWHYFSVVVCIRRLVPPNPGAEFAESDEVGPASAFGNELASPFVEKFVLSENHRSVRDICVGRPNGGRVIPLSHAVKEFAGTVHIAASEFAFGKGIYDFRQSVP